MHVFDAIFAYTAEHESGLICRTILCVFLSIISKYFNIIVAGLYTYL
jgi:hypothetical protein